MTDVKESLVIVMPAILSVKADELLDVCGAHTVLVCEYRSQ